MPDTIKILQGLKSYFEDFHAIRYTNEALKAAVELSSRYMADRKLPDKAIDVIDEVGASQMLLPASKRKKTVSVKDIEATIATMARIPPKTVSKDDTEKLKGLCDVTLKRVVFGQDEAIAALAASIKLSRASVCARRKNRLAAIGSPARPVSVKPKWRANWLPLWVSNFICALICRNIWSVIPYRACSARLGYVGYDQGGLLTDGVDQNPHSCCCSTRLKKRTLRFVQCAAASDGPRQPDRRQPAAKDDTDFRNVILIMTTNAGASDMAKEPMGFGRVRREGEDTEAINRMLTPEFRNRCLDMTLWWCRFPICRRRLLSAWSRSLSSN